jgi:hypothetical protein
MIARLIALLTGRAMPTSDMPVSPVPKLPTELRVARRLDPDVPLVKMDPDEQVAFWRGKRPA